MALPENVRVEYRLDATINLGDFQNVKPGYTISADVPSGTNPKEVRDKLKATAKGWLEEDVQEYKDDN